MNEMDITFFKLDGNEEKVEMAMLVRYSSRRNLLEGTGNEVEQLQTEKQNQPVFTLHKARDFSMS